MASGGGWELLPPHSGDGTKLFCVKLWGGGVRVRIGVDKGMTFTRTTTLAGRTPTPSPDTRPQGIDHQVAERRSASRHQVTCHHPGRNVIVHRGRAHRYFQSRQPWHAPRRRARATTTTATATATATAI